MDTKKELIIGTIGGILIIILTLFYSNQYQILLQKPITNGQLSGQATGKTITTGTTVTLSKAEVSKHNSQNDCWLIINNDVYQVTEYLALHPGGAAIIIPYCGQDATVAYDTKDGRGSHSSRANQDLSNLKLGSLNQVINQSNNIKSNLNNISNTNKSGKEFEDD